MNTKEGIKSKLWNHLNGQLDEKILHLQSALISITESKNSETKSSAGDKFETSREMMQVEEDKLEWQHNNLKHLKAVLKQIDPNLIRDKIELGSLILTNQGNYFISIGLGKVNIDDVKYYAISLDSPLGKFVQNKEIGWKGAFLNKPFEILEIL